jgi:hypothetical protein
MLKSIDNYNDNFINDWFKVTVYCVNNVNIFKYEIIYECKVLKCPITKPIKKKQTRTCLLNTNAPGSDSCQ